MGGGWWDRRKIMPTSSHNPFGFFPQVRVWQKHPFKIRWLPGCTKVGEKQCMEKEERAKVNVNDGPDTFVKATMGGACKLPEPITSI